MVKASCKDIITFLNTSLFQILYVEVWQPLVEESIMPKVDGKFDNTLELDIVLRNFLVSYLKDSFLHRSEIDMVAKES